MTLDELRQHEPLWDKWYIKERLGGGSYGDVYRIERNSYDKSYEAALKVISIPKDTTELNEVTIGFDSVEETKTYYDKLRESISKEIDMMEQLKGRTNIVSYEDHDIIPHNQGRDPGYDIFIRMELLQDLTSIINKESKTWTDNSEIVKIGADIAEGLRVCHSHNIIHRDIKLGNIFRSKDGDYKIGDFGIAKDVSDDQFTMSIKGTFSYMAPEVYNREHYDFRADVYSLGMVLYHLLNKNRGPFLPLTGPSTVDQKDAALVQRMRGDAMPAPVNASEALAEIVLKACSYRQEDRYAGMEEFREALLELKPDHLTRIEQTPVRSVVADTEGTVAMRSDSVATNSSVAFGEEGTVAMTSADEEGTTAMTSADEEGTIAMTSVDEEGTVAMVSEDEEGTVAMVTGPVEEKDDAKSGKTKLIPMIGGIAAAVAVIAIVCVAAFGTKDSGENAPVNTVAEDTAKTENMESEIAEEEALEEAKPQPEEPQMIEPVIAEEIRAVGTIKNSENRVDNCIYEGDDFSTIRLKGSFAVSDTDTTSVEGTLELDDTGTISQSGEYSWTFTPQDTQKYDSVSGSVHITAMHVGMITSMDEFNAIEDKASIQMLVLDGVGLTNLDPIKDCTNLVLLSLADNDLTDISAIKHMKKLQQLNLSDNSRLSDISPLLGLKKLKLVALEDTAVSDENKTKVTGILQN